MSQTPNAPTVETLQADLAALQAQFAAQGEQLTAANTRIAETERAARVGECQTLFTAIGMAYTDEAAAPYLGMDAATFSAVAGGLRAGVKPAAPVVPAAPTMPAHLFAETAIGTPGAAVGSDVAALALAARQFKSTQDAAGIPCSYAQAVAHVRAMAATGE